MENYYNYFFSLAVLILTMVTLGLKRRRMEYDYMLLLTALVIGFFVTEQFEVQKWFYRLPLMGVAVSVSMLVLALILFMFGTESRRVKRKTDQLY